jgi:hypothetical protein
MKSEPEILVPQATPCPPQTTFGRPTSGVDADPESPLHPDLPDDNKGNGKIACLPKAIRDQVNHWLLDRVPHLDIIERLGEYGKGLRPNNVHQWKKHGHQNWLRQRDFLAEITSQSEFAADLVSAPDSLRLHEAALRIAGAQMLDYFMRLGVGSETAGPPSQSQTDQLSRLCNALSRLSREAVHFQKYRDEIAKAVAVELKRLNPKRELSDAEDATIMDALDDFLKRPRRKRHDSGNGAPGAAPLSQPGTPPPPSTKNGLQQSATSDQAITPPPLVAPVAPKSVKAEPAGNVRPPGSNEKQPRATPPALPSPNPNAGPPAIPAPPLPLPKIAGPAPVEVVKSLAPPVIQVPTPPVIQVPALPSSSASPSSSPAAACAPEFCPSCQALLPELLPTGERPFPGCWRCGQRLLEPNTELCPGCRCPLPKLAPDGQRPHVDCRLCGTILPPATAAPS